MTVSNFPPGWQIWRSAITDSVRARWYCHIYISGSLVTQDFSTFTQDLTFAATSRARAIRKIRVDRYHIMYVGGSAKHVLKAIFDSMMETCDFSVGRGSSLWIKNNLCKLTDYVGEITQQIPCVGANGRNTENGFALPLRGQRSAACPLVLKFLVWSLYNTLPSAIVCEFLSILYYSKTWP